MSANTKIEWCDHTFNPWTGCMKVSPGCDHCYAEGWSKRAGAKVGKWGPGAPRVRTTAANWKLPIKWEAGAGAFQAAHGRRQRVFCASLADVFDNEVDPQWRADLFDLIRNTPNLDWLLLTKRIGNVEAMAEAAGGWPENAWSMITVVNQEEADRDIPKALAVKEKLGIRILGLSMEPLLGPVSLRQSHVWKCCERPLEVLDGDGWTSPRYAYECCQDPDIVIDWVIAGGESGPGARPSHPDWYRALRDQCAAAGVPFLFKQWGEWAPGSNFPDHIPSGISSGDGHEDARMWKVGKKAAGRLLDGITHDGFPS